MTIQPNNQETKGHEITYQTKRVTYYNGSISQIRKANGWSLKLMVYNLGDELRAIDKFVTLGYIVKVKQEYKSSAIYINK